MSAAERRRSADVLRHPVVALAALLALAAALAEVLLDPAGDERLRLLGILALPAIGAVVVAPLLTRWVSARASVASAVLVAGGCSLALASVSTAAASSAMFVSGHDLRLFLVVLLVSSGVALVMGTMLTRPLAADVGRLGEVAERVAEGDLAVRTGISRRDEVGAAAAAIDQMVARLADAEAERARVAAARQLMFTSIGHDLRTPMAAMRAAVESLQDGVAPDPDRYLGVVAAQLTALEGLLDQLVEFSRLASGHATGSRVRLSLAELADDCVEAMAPLAARGGARLLLDADGPATVVGSPLELGRVLRNLVDNALRHGAPGGTVRVRVRGDGSGVGGPGGAVEVRVTDDGPGFPDEFRAIAFDPFTRADAARGAAGGGTGLGLAISRAIVEAHGGTIELGPGPGGDVRVRLPVAPATDPRDDDHAATADPAPSRSGGPLLPAPVERQPDDDVPAGTAPDAAQRVRRRSRLAGDTAPARETADPTGRAGRTPPAQHGGGSIRRAGTPPADDRDRGEPATVPGTRTTHGEAP